MPKRSPKSKWGRKNTIFYLNQVHTHLGAGKVARMRFSSHPPHQKVRKIALQSMARSVYGSMPSWRPFGEGGGQPCSQMVEPCSQKRCIPLWTRARKVRHDIRHTSRTNYTSTRTYSAPLHCHNCTPLSLHAFFSPDA